MTIFVKYKKWCSLPALCEDVTAHTPVWSTECLYDTRLQHHTENDIACNQTQNPQKMKRSSVYRLIHLITSHSDEAEGEQPILRRETVVSVPATSCDLDPSSQFRLKGKDKKQENWAEEEEGSRDPCLHFNITITAIHFNSMTSSSCHDDTGKNCWFNQKKKHFVIKHIK